MKRQKSGPDEKGRSQIPMKNAEISTSTKDDFWKSQFVKHDPAPVSAPPPAPRPLLTATRVAPKPAGAAQEPAISTMEETFRAVRATQSTLSFENFVSLVLLKFPAKARAQWEWWLMNQKAALMKKWNLSE
jgi:hypothetical protein